jgi:hypothetical protein
MKKSKQAIPAQMPLTDDPAQAYAMRVWNGQSISLPHTDRVQRVMAALAEQGIDSTAVQLPASE